MRIGIGLPAHAPGMTARRAADWARAAEEDGFSTLGVTDRVAYANCDPLVALAAAAARTSRIRLATTVLLAAARGDAVPLAKQAASLAALTAGRFVLGVAAGGRADDYELCGVPYRERGRRLDAMLGRMNEVWSGDVVGPRARPTVIVGGHSPAAMRRAARFGAGWIGGGTSATGYAELAARARTAWAGEDRTDRPWLMGQLYFALGPEADVRAARYLHDYFAFAGEWAKVVARQALTSPAAIRAKVAEYADAGCDELILMPCAAGTEQVHRLADVTC
ncbi:LLM class flavin-dependent oxidoreductase [Amycolatopsis sp. A133]|uniref:LLM class flavin-dependent oxidoreductase n=1 Tax=Amycolatopsis sp. A133 TaxID=3064472 RepID=UPI0027FED4CF|nr:LLM class flavin-dependent oxidoreductase [Amycolatopsis sp. A133]MDQ7803522.1 LLM class flavin-dependent oxidoreductase [Amycolatopsis sp. A133]